MFNLSFTNVLNKYSSNSTTFTLINNTSLSYLSLHYRLSSCFYLNQLVDIFSYEVNDNLKSNLIENDIKNINEENFSSLIVYNFHSIISQNRNFIFIKNLEKIKYTSSNPSSISDQFSSANWLERESSELTNINFQGKKDLRNLMLQYGDTSSPLLKSFPSIGFKETYYSSNLDLVIQKDVTINL